MTIQKIVLAACLLMMSVHLSEGGKSWIWFNYATQQYDSLEQPPQSDAEAQQYIAQNSSAQGLYKVYRQQGHDILTALEKVLKVQAGMSQ